YTGAAAVVVERGRRVLEVAVGRAQAHDRGTPLAEPPAATVDTIYDVASLTKVCATTAAVMCLVGDGALDVDTPVGAFVPEFIGGAKDGILLRHLLTHRAGLWEWWPLYAGTAGPREALHRAAGLPLRYPVDASRHYSDLGMVLAGEIVERVAGEPLDAFAARRVFAPLGMIDTGFLPDPGLEGRIAATSTGNPHEVHMLATGEPYPTGVSPDAFTGWRHHTLVGEVNDGNAHYAFEGSAGHAGLFSTARDVAAFGQELLGSDPVIFDPAVVERFTRDDVEPGQGLGFWTDRLGDAGLGRGGFGHSGFTGCELLVDRSRELVAVLLTNRLHVGYPHPVIRPAWRDLLEVALGARDAPGPA
ncbi:MAG: serine hydrolase domain-containing protein, partial [Actinomycetota bacterium]